MFGYLGFSSISLFWGGVFSSIVVSSNFGGGGFRWLFIVMLEVFFIFRVPFVFDVLWFGGFIVFFVVGFYFPAVGCHLGSVVSFLCGFVCEGSPVVFALIACGIEVVSYLVRPVVLLLRPVVNLVLGWFLVDVSLRYLGVVVCNVGVSGVFCVVCCYFGVLLVLFYEWCVSCVQWYILKEFVVVESELGS